VRDELEPASELKGFSQSSILNPQSSAIVFAYHNVGVRCLSVLLAQGVDVKLVVTHRDNPDENIWFDSVAELAQLHGIAVITPDNPNTMDVVEQIRALQPDFFFSFYYRCSKRRCWPFRNRAR
jgi:methionyl-tRNA formyltransferase